MAETKLVGHNYTTPDMLAKVTGKAKFAEDFRADGMLFARQLLSPMPHARVTRIDTSAALAMPGVKAIVTADDLPKPAGGGVTDLGQKIEVDPHNERALTMEPMYQGEPILAVAAVDELTAAEAIEKLVIEYQDFLPRMGFSKAACVRTFMTDDWRLTHYKGENWGELYDRRNDPDESHNLWDEPAHAKKRGELTDRLAGLQKGPKPPLVTLRADRVLDWGRVAAVMGELNAAGFKSISLVTNSSVSAP